MLVAEKAASAFPSKHRQGLPRSERLRRRDEFQRVYQQGLRESGRFMVVFALARDDDRSAGRRVGVTASRKVGGAVVRARSKRRLRELFRTDPARRTGRPVDLVINARRGCAAAPWDELLREYRRCVSSLDKRLANA